jgi:hypothetical protein
MLLGHGTGKHGLAWHHCTPKDSRDKRTQAVFYQCTAQHARLGRCVRVAEHKDSLALGIPEVLHYNGMDSENSVKQAMDRYWIDAIVRVE